MSVPGSQHPNADVRMRGFAERISVEAALAWLDGELERRGRLSTELVALEEAAGRVLGQEITSKVNVPNFRRAMMDGFALQAADIATASPGNPITLDILGDCFPGADFSGRVASGQVVRIMTGAPIPRGADSVLPVEQTEKVGGQVRALKSLSVGKHLGSVGEDIACGDVLLTPGASVASPRRWRALVDRTKPSGSSASATGSDRCDGRRIVACRIATPREPNRRRQWAHAHGARRSRRRISPSSRNCA